VAITLLVVDDQASLRRLFEVVAGEDPRFAEVVSAATAADAIRLAAEHQPGAVLLDVGLGKDDGLEAISPLRAAAADTVVVIYSSQPNADHDSARRAGADLFVPKGTDPDLILDLVVHAVTSRRDPEGRLHLDAEVSRSL
jgi:DNA-binding NarL/FixJ family response regulator